MYSIKLLNDKEKKTAKGVKKNVLNNDIKNDNYKKVINHDSKNGFYENSLMNVTRSKLHDI